MPLPPAPIRRLLGAIFLVVSALTPGAASAQVGLQLPADFHATVFAGGLSSPTALAVGPDNRTYVAEGTGQIVAIGPAGTALIASGLATPLGLAWYRRALYVSWTGHVTRLTPSKNYGSFTARTIVSGLPVGRHQNDGITFRGTWMYVGVGSTCNACVEQDPRSATIMRFHLDGSQAQVFARGLRNPYGLAFRPGTSQLYATDNGRDDFGNSVPDELNLIVRSGNYGWPDCWGNGGGTHCSGTRAPLALLAPHASADGIAFYNASTYPARYRGDAFIAEWGDDVTTLGTGHIVVRVHFTGSHARVSTFAAGFSHPLAVAVGPGGALLVADNGTGTIWRIQVNGH
jgi:glucose/arabinose dehydrogenase